MDLPRPKLDAPMDREHSDCGLSVDFDFLLYVKELPKKIEIKLHFISFVSHLCYRGDGFFLRSLSVAYSLVMFRTKTNRIPGVISICIFCKLAGQYLKLELGSKVAMVTDYCEHQHHVTVWGPISIGSGISQLFLKNVSP